MLRPLLLLIAALAAGPALPAQDEVAAALRAGREALAAGDHVAACRHLCFALERSEDPLEALLLLLENAAEDPDARRLWAHDLYALAGDRRGRLPVPAAERRRLLGDDPHPAAVAAARARAVAEILRLRRQRARGRGPADRLAVEWLEDLARSIAAPSPALLAAIRDEADPAIPPDPELEQGVIRELERIVRATLGTGETGQAVEAARVLRGLVAQAGFDDLEGPPPPDLGAAAEVAAEGLARGRAALAARNPDGVPLEDLEAMDEAEQRAFTLAHGGFDDPGVTWSPRRWYRVETSCGWQTLVGAATTVEAHHERLARWYGRDPFVGRPGILRIVPESSGLEMEGAPFFWVGGFQGGDTTTLKMTIGTIPGLGRGITHELTHRFDGAVYGGLPAWLGEGRAVWTAAAYGSIHDEEFVPNHAVFATQVQTRRKGYGRRDKLEELISGEVEDYRENYGAGYSLWLFLSTWAGEEPAEDDPAHPTWTGRPLFRARLEEYMQDRRRRRGDPIRAFARAFADGEEGRPDGMDAFAEEFDRFLAGFSWHDPAPWRDERYTQEVPAGDPAPLVLDEPTWSWERQRAEPWFGQEQARVAGELMAARGRHEQAAQALLWSLAVDEPAPATLDLLASELRAAGESEAAWLLEHWPRFRLPARAAPAPGPAPLLSELPSVRELAAAWAAAAAAAAAAGAPLAAEALAAEHDRLADVLGLPSAPPPAPGPSPRERAETFLAARQRLVLHPFDPPPRPLGAAGWSEDGLTGHEEFRVEGEWCLGPAGDLHVGRRRPRTGTDTMDRASPWRDAFVLARDWLEPGRYRVFGRIEFTTAWVAGGVVLGWTRRDRNLRFGFSGGDPAFAAGEVKTSTGMDGISWSLDGLWLRQRAVTGRHGFRGRRNGFDFELRVDGPVAELHLDGDRVGWLCTVDGSPIQGRVGFFVSQGSIRVRRLRVQRLDRSGWAAGGAASGGGLHPWRRGGEGWADLAHRPVGGFRPGRSGSILVWFPADLVPDQEWSEDLRARIERLAAAWQEERPSQDLVVLVPTGREEVAQAALAETAGRIPAGLRILGHDRPGGLADAALRIGGRPPVTLAFVDPAGILRHQEKMRSWRGAWSDEMRHWIELHLDHSRPGQAGRAD